MTDSQLLIAVEWVLTAPTAAARQAAVDHLWELAGGRPPALRPKGHPLNLARAILIAEALRRLAARSPGPRRDTGT